MLELTEGALVAATADDVWADFTDAARLAEWFWPPRLESAVTIEPQELGAWRVRSDVAGIGVNATIVAIEPPRALRLGWRWDGEPGVTDVEITFEDAADASTRVIVRQSGFATAGERTSHVEGWVDCLQRLVDRYAA
ncbi:uncharacterized protein YndB with AHSA1/START domain [Microbacterium terrae]|uniref:Activator of Hsp90 ATPase homologue 1/2-like C-terminal domain-containing protein n=1 Tax=Microbacterium terrae TaxID=69369 RepID=A0A0M2H9L9_9MICO|nr:SRPBCC family protein [Microbacterium terrae]KJL41330.1 hypothetical protein RS81_01398 [Microbacterium terrae]MBP1077632.1 uncharacterized protein YndB with AHSA1/START domain [Microbacterium terrae]GLJ99237.1 hypothetical protein GCM10017594_24340 [Microbacterium terrae]